MSAFELNKFNPILNLLYIYLCNRIIKRLVELTSQLKVLSYTWLCHTWSQYLKRTTFFFHFISILLSTAAAAAAKLFQSCPTAWPHRWQATGHRHPWDSPGKNTGVGCHFLPQCMKMKSESEVTESCPTLSDPMDCSLPGSSVHGIFQARVLELGAIAFSNCQLQLQKKRV